MAYTNPQRVRDLLGVDIDAAPDSILNTYIGYADQIIIKSITETIVDEDLEQDGNDLTIHMTKYPYIADIDKDKSIGTLDVLVYYWDDNNNKITLNVDTVNGLTGQVKLKAQVPTGEDARIDYNRYICKPDWTLIELASTYYAAFMWVGRELYLVPERYFLGDLRIYGKEPWKHFKDQYDRLIQIIVNQPISVVEYEKMVIVPREKEEKKKEEELILHKEMDVTA